MPQISSFLAEYKTGPLYRLLENKILEYHMLEDILGWCHIDDISVHSSDPKFNHLPDALFSKEACDIWVTFR